MKGYIYAAFIICTASSLNGELLINSIINQNVQTTLQKTANLLFLFITEQPQIADDILSENTTDNIFQEKTAVLDMITKICKLSSLEELKSKSPDKIHSYEKKINNIYQQIYVKLDNKYRKIIYGPNCGAMLPERIFFFEKIAPKEDTSQPPILSLIEKISCIFC